ncbi:PH domain-containing protein [Carnobacterium divergens]|uniref:PH domain-containing protein n=1 Tax=Carnobacterium divergens TaxID=2748 RepID=UPI0028926335|nr:PH domain-containing protein [Carnobacterium divergens]MDT1950097.1 PH domain-containing protein [Carnobacterium divergens]MDT1955275.1 PH domain-containing protein [Carnobacterium divergens]MDT1960513.1 PH domain-containing protein [Carnobacterium divergens]MDT1963057.1 PH domain-containing protein [Carnobacterium divergens]
MAKLVCGVCQTPITLSMTRYATKDKNKICKACGKRAGLNAFSSQDLTIDQIISNNTGTNEHSEKVKKIMDQLELAGVTDTFGTKKEINHLPEIIHDNEIIKYASSGTFNGNTVLVVVTDLRIIFLDKGFIYGTTKTEIPLDKVNSVSYKKGLLLANLTLFNGAAPVKVDNMQNATIEKLVSILNNCVTEYNNRNMQITSIPNPSSSADEIRKFKMLLDEGIITQEEFDIKKGKLLSL